MKSTVAGWCPLGLIASSPPSTRAHRVFFLSFSLKSTLRHCWPCRGLRACTSGEPMHCGAESHTPSLLALPQAMYNLDTGEVDWFGLLA